MNGTGTCSCKSGFSGLTCNITIPDKLTTGISPGGIAGIVIAIIVVVAGGVVAFVLWWKFLRNATFVTEEELQKMQESGKEGEDGGDGGDNEGGNQEEGDFNSEDLSFVEE